MDLLMVLVVVIYGMLTLIPVALVAMLVAYAARHATQRVNSCWACQYDLTHLRDGRRCPECGHPFEVDARGDAISSGFQRAG